MASLSTILNCENCGNKLEDNEGFRCQCNEDDTPTSSNANQYFCEDCVLSHTKKSHTVKDRMGKEIAICRKHLLLPHFYCRNDMRLVCRRCSCRKLNHDLVEVSDETKFRKQIFELCNKLEDKEKDLKSRKNLAEELLSWEQKQSEDLERFVYESMKAIEQKIVTNRNKTCGEKVQKIKDDTESCIERTIAFQEKLRNFLALSGSALGEQFLQNEKEIVSLIEEQDEHPNLVSFLQTDFQGFDASKFIQETADKFLQQVQLPVLKEVVPSEDLTLEHHVEIENFSEIEKELKTSVVLEDIALGTWILKKQPNGQAYEIVNIWVNEKGPTPPNSMSTTVKVTKSFPSNIKTSISSTVTYAYNFNKHRFKDSNIVLVFENGWYCVFEKSKKRVVKEAQVGYADVLGPVKVDSQGKQVEWAYWDEEEKVVRVSGMDAINISCKQKPRLFTVQISTSEMHREFAVVNEDLDVLVINPDSADGGSTVIPRKQHNLQRIDTIWFFTLMIYLFDFNSNRCVILEEELNKRRENNGCGEIYPYKVKHVGHWKQSKSVIVSIPGVFFWKRLCATFNVGTTSDPQIKKYWFRTA